MPIPKLIAPCLALTALLAAVPSRAADLSDEFKDPATLSRWSRHHQREGWPDTMKRIEIDPSGDGTLVMEPWTSGWYAEFHGPFLYKEVTGDFSVTTRLQARGKSSEIPSVQWSLAGLMVRKARTTGKADWKPGEENWLFLTTGIAEEPDKPVFESKTTVGSRSKLELNPARSGWLEMKIARKGPRFDLSYRYPGEDWVLHRTFDRPDLPRTVQVGLISYTDWYSAADLQRDPLRFNSTKITNGKPDLVVLVDYVRFEAGE